MPDPSFPFPEITCKPIPGFPGYFASEDGRVWSRKRGGWRELRQWTSKQGYPCAGPCVDGSQIKRAVAWFVARAFHGEPPTTESGKPYDCRHLDGNPGNSRADNLAWGTRSENMRDIARHGRRRFSIGEIHEIRESMSRGQSHAELGRRHGVPASTISNVAIGEKYGWIDNPDGTPYTHARRVPGPLSDEDIDRLVSIVDGGTSTRSAAKQLGISKDQAFRAMKRRFGVRSSQLRRRACS